MNKKIRIYIILHIMLAVYSLSGVCSKMAAKYVFFSNGFCLYYGVMVLILAFYAFGWQQIIKRLPLTAAYANKAVTVFWGAVWGWLVFNEEMRPNKILGIVLVICGIVLFAMSDKERTIEEQTAIEDSDSSSNSSMKIGHGGGAS